MITLKQRAEIAVLLLGELCPPELQVALGCGYEACKRLICELEEKGRLSHLKGDTYRAGKANNELERRIGHNRGTLDPDSAREAIEAITEKKAENGRVRERIRIRNRDDDDDDTEDADSTSGDSSDESASKLTEGAKRLIGALFGDKNDNDGDNSDNSDDDDDFDWLDDDDDDTEDNSSDTDSDNDRGIEGLEAFITRRRRLADRSFERRRLCTREGANTAEGTLGNRIAEALFDSFTVLYSNEMYNINDTQTYNPVAFMVNECSRWYYSDKGHTISHLMKTLDVTTDRVSNAIAKVVEMYDCRMVAGEILTKKEIDPDTAVKQLIEFLAMIEHLKRLKVSEMYLLVSLDMQEQIRDTFKRLIIENAECNRTQLIERVDEAIRALTAEGSYDRVECFCYEAIRDHLDGSTDDEFLFFKASLLNI